MCRFIETIRVENGRIWNLPYHNARLNTTRSKIFGKVSPLQIEDYIEPGKYVERTRCRIVYGKDIEKIAYFQYELRPVRTLKLITCDHIDYRYKSTDRSLLDSLFALRGQADDILIVRDGRLTDTSIANIALWDGEKWDTPARPLLKGTRRQELLDHGVLHEQDILAGELCKYQRIRLFNAMILFGEIELDCRSVE